MIVTTPQKLLMSAALALALTACTSVAENEVVRTDIGGGMSQMWSNVFDGQLRSAPQPLYQFGNKQTSDYNYGGTDATLNTRRLASRVAVQAQRQRMAYSPQSAQPQYYRAPHTRIQPKPQAEPTFEAPQSIARMPAPQPDQRKFLTATPEPVAQTPKTKKSSLRKRIGGLFKKSNRQSGALSGYENQSEPKLVQKQASAPSPNLPAKPPARSQPVYSPQVTTPAPQLDKNWEAANQQIGDSLSYVKMGGGSQIADWKACEQTAGGYFTRGSASYLVKPEFDRCMRTRGYRTETEAVAELSARAAENIPQRKVISSN